MFRRHPEQYESENPPPPQCSLLRHPSRTMLECAGYWLFDGACRFPTCKKRLNPTRVAGACSAWYLIGSSNICRIRASSHGMSLCSSSGMRALVILCVYRRAPSIWLPFGSLSSVISPMFVVLSLSLLSSGPRGHLENDMQPIFRWKFRALRTTAQRSIRYILPMTTTVCNLHEKNGRGPGGVFWRETAQDPSQ